jgi:hypothetical protein
MNAMPVGESPTGGFANYYWSNDPNQWLERVPFFARVRYPNAYRGIDVLFHGSHDELEYDFEVSPGASPGSIAFDMDGADDIAISSDGSIRITAGHDTWRILPPVAYQTTHEGRKSVQIVYRLLAKNRVAFKLGDYDPSAKLTIDPVVQYANLISANNRINVAAIQVDAAGDLFIAGDTGASNYPVVNGIPSGSLGQVYVTKLNPAGDTILYSTFLASTGSSSAQGLALDASGNAYVTGGAGNGFPFTSNLGSCTSNCQGGFVAKLSSTGSLTYATLLGAVSPRTITVDSAGKAYVAGDTGGPGLLTVNAFEPSYVGLVCTTCSNAFFARLNSIGNAFDFASFFASPSQTSGELLATGIGLDPSGNVLLAGFSVQGGAPPLLNSWQQVAGTLFLAKFAPDGKTLLFSTQFGSSASPQNDTLTGMRVGTDGTVYLVGTTQSQDFPYAINAAGHQVLPNGFASGTFSMFATAINPALNGLTYSTYLGDGFTNSMAVDPAGHLYVTGTSVLNLIPLANAVVGDVTSGGFVLVLDQTGTPVSVSQFGGHFIEQAPTAVAADGAGNVFVAGPFSPQNVSPPEQPDPVIVGPALGQATGGNFGSFFAEIAATNIPQISLNTAPPFLIFRNAGSADLHVSGISLTGGLAKQWGNCGTVIPAGTSCTLTVTDANGGLAAGTVTINSDAVPNQQIFPITLAVNQTAGTPVGDQVIFEDLRFAYPPQLTGTSTAPESLAISNVGTANATINSVTTQGSASQTNDCGILAPGATCHVQVSLTAGGAQPAMHVVYDTTLRQDFNSFFLNPTTQQLMASASAINFGTQLVNGVAIPRVVTITNTGNTSAPAPGVSFSGASEFSLAGNTCSPTLSPHQSCVVGVKFVPTADGSRSATLNIGANSVSLGGVGMINSQVTVSPLEIDYGPNIVGKTFTLPLGLSNTTGSAISITGISFSLPDYTETDNCSGQVPANSSCTLQITFAPGQLGARNANISIIFGGGVLAQVVTLTGTGVTPLDVTPASLDFGMSTAVGTSSAAQNVSLGNGRQSASQAYTLALTGDFVITQNTCPNPMPGFTGCANLQIAFAPKAPGAQQGSLTVSYPNISVQSVVSLTGTGVGPAVSLAGSSDFGNQIKGTSTTQNITLTNSGNAPLAISGISASEDFTQTNTCGSSLAASQSCQISTTFAPSATGARSGTLTINDNAPGSPHTLALTGNGTDFQLAGTSGTPSVTISSGQTATYNLSISGSSGFTGTVTLACSGAPLASNCGIAPGSVAISGPSSVPVTVTVATTANSSVLKVPGPSSWKSPTVLGLLSILSMFFLALTGLRRMRKAALVTATGMAIILGVAACGGGSGSTPVVTHNGTPAGTYTLTVTGSIGGATRQLQLTLVVQ